MDDGNMSTDENEGDQQVARPVNQDASRLLKIAPEVVWKLVAKKVLDRKSDDHQHLVNSSQFYQNLRASERTTILFEHVFPLVVASVWKKEGLKGFPSKDVLKCREVCKHWNIAIQKVVPEKFAFHGKSFFAKGIIDAKFKKIGSTFERIIEEHFKITSTSTDGMTAKEKKEEEKYSVHRFLNYFRQTHPPTYQPTRPNPFFCNKVELRIWKEEESMSAADYEHYLQGILSLLSTYGTQVEILCLEDCDVDLLEKALSMLPQWLSLLPNIKKFEIIDRERNDLGEVNLDAAIAHQLPKLESLESIGIHSKPLPIFNQLIQRNNHVSELHVEGPEEYDLLLCRLPNLKKLGIRECERDIVELLATPQVQWSLESLMLDIKFVGGYGRLFQVIQDKFAATLVSLELDIDKQVEDVDSAVWKDCHNLRLDLPKLKHFRFWCFRRPVCLDFLLPMRNHLEEIATSFNYEMPPISEMLTPDELLTPSVLAAMSQMFATDEKFATSQHSSYSGSVGEHIIEYIGFEERMLESNVWQIFEKLNKFEVQTIFAFVPYFRKDCVYEVLKNQLREKERIIQELMKLVNKS